MIPTQFDYLTPATLDEAVSLLGQHADEAKILAGGHSLIPAMKLRLATPQVLIDIGRIKDLSYIREEGGQIRIGAMTTHYQMEASDRLREICPLLPECAAQIGDVQVRNKGPSAEASRIRIRPVIGPRPSSRSARRWLRLAPTASA